MKWIRKLVVSAVVLVVLLALLLFVAVQFLLGRGVKMAVEEMGPRITQTDVTVDDVRISPLGGRVEIQGLIVGNPEGFNTDSAFQLGRVLLQVEPRSLLSDEIVIREVTIEAPQVTYEAALSGSNITVIRESVDAFVAKLPKPGERPADDKPGKRVVIDNLVVSEGKIRLSGKILQGEAVAVSLPRVQLRDVGRPSGTSWSDTVSAVFGVVLSGVSGLKDLAGDVLQQGREALQGVAEGGLQDAGEKLGDSVKGLGEKTGEQAEKAVDSLKGLFGK
jgi:hypothetical protein